MLRLPDTYGACNELEILNRLLLGQPLGPQCLVALDEPAPVCNSIDNCSDPIGRSPSSHAWKQTEGALTESSEISSSSNWSYDCQSDRVAGSVPLRQRGVVALFLSPATS
eukprot:7134888-Prymnesium_polylepis.1